MNLSLFSLIHPMARRAPKQSKFDFNKALISFKSEESQLRRCSAAMPAFLTAVRFGAGGEHSVPVDAKHLESIEISTSPQTLISEAVSVEEVEVIGSPHEEVISLDQYLDDISRIGPDLTASSAIYSLRGKVHRHVEVLQRVAQSPREEKEKMDEEFRQMRD